jgi:hypothetical protein
VPHTVREYLKLRLVIMLHDLLVTAHILGAFALAAALAVEASALVRLRTARSAATLAEALRPLRSHKFLMPPAILGLLAGGPALVVTNPKGGWSGLLTPWLIIPLLVTMAMAAIGLGVLGPKLGSLAERAGSGDYTYSYLAADAHSRVLHFGAWGGIGSFVAVLVMMSARPGLAVCLIVLAAGVSLGLLTARQLSRSAPGAATPNEPVNAG